MCTYAILKKIFVHDCYAQVKNKPQMPKSSWNITQAGEQKALRSKAWSEEIGYDFTFYYPKYIFEHVR